VAVDDGSDGAVDGVIRCGGSVIISGNNTTVDFNFTMLNNSYPNVVIEGPITVTIKNYIAPDYPIVLLANGNITLNRVQHTTVELEEDFQHLYSENLTFVRIMVSPDVELERLCGAVMETSDLSQSAGVVLCNVSNTAVDLSQRPFVALHNATNVTLFGVQSYASSIYVEESRNITIANASIRPLGSKRPDPRPTFPSVEGLRIINTYMYTFGTIRGRDILLSNFTGFSNAFCYNKPFKLSAQGVRIENSLFSCLEFEGAEDVVVNSTVVKTYNGTIPDYHWVIYVAHTPSLIIRSGRNYTFENVAVNATYGLALTDLTLLQEMRVANTTVFGKPLLLVNGGNATLTGGEVGQLLALNATVRLENISEEEVPPVILVHAYGSNVSMENITVGRDPASPYGASGRGILALFYGRESSLHAHNVTVKNLSLRAFYGWKPLALFYGDYSNINVSHLRIEGHSICDVPDFRRCSRTLVSAAYGTNLTLSNVTGILEGMMAYSNHWMPSHYCRVEDVNATVGFIDSSLGAYRCSDVLIKNVTITGRMVPYGNRDYLGVAASKFGGLSWSRVVMDHVFLHDEHVENNDTMPDGVPIAHYLFFSLGTTVVNNSYLETPIAVTVAQEVVVENTTLQTGRSPAVAFVYPYPSRQMKIKDSHLKMDGDRAYIYATPTRWYWDAYKNYSITSPLFLVVRRAGASIHVENSSMSCGSGPLLLVTGQGITSFEGSVVSFTIENSSVNCTAVGGENAKAPNGSTVLDWAGLTSYPLEVRGGEWLRPIVEGNTSLENESLQELAFLRSSLSAVNFTAPHYGYGYAQLRELVVAVRDLVLNATSLEGMDAVLWNVSYPSEGNHSFALENITVVMAEGRINASYERVEARGNGSLLLNPFATGDVVYVWDSDNHTYYVGINESVEPSFDRDGGLKVSIALPPGLPCSRVAVRAAEGLLPPSEVKARGRRVSFNCYGGILEFRP